MPFFKSVSQAEFHRLARQGSARGVAVVSQPGKLVDGASTIDDSRVRRFVFSDGTVDRMNDSIDPNGWDTSEFERNPVALWSHDSSSPPIGKATRVWSDGARLLGDIKFAAEDEYAFAETILRLIDGQYLNGVSVGFLPTRWEYTKDEARPYGINFLEQKLLEISVCPIPANPNALATARGFGIDTAPLAAWAAKALHRGGVGAMSAVELKSFRRRAAERTRYAPTLKEEAVIAGALARVRKYRARSGSPSSRSMSDEAVLERALTRVAAHRKQRPAIDPRIVAAEARFRFLRW